MRKARCIARVSELGEPVQVELALEGGQALHVEMLGDDVSKEGVFVVNAERLTVRNEGDNMALIIILGFEEKLMELLWESHCGSRRTRLESLGRVAVAR